MSKRNQNTMQVELLMTIINKDKQLQSEISRRININLNKLRILQSKNPPEIKVSNHFLIRYCERVKELSHDDLLSNLKKLYSQTIIDNLGTCRIRQDSKLLIIRGYTFITIHNIRNNGTQFKL